MLAKLWKKVLLAICIIACIFNIMSKLVNRHSLRENLESANDGETVFSIFQKDEVVESESTPIIEGVINKEPTQGTANEIETNTSVVITYPTNENIQTEENTTVTDEIVNESKSIEENSQEPQVEEKEEKKAFSFSDFTILF